MRRIISDCLASEPSAAVSELEVVLTAEELRRAHAAVGDFALVAAYSILFGLAERDGPALSPGQFHDYWAMAFKTAAERAELSPSQMDARWSAFNRCLRSYVTLWHAVPQADLQRHGVLHWARRFFADHVVPSPIAPPRAVKERHTRVFETAGLVARDALRAAAEAFGAARIVV